MSHRIRRALVSSTIVLVAVTADGRVVAEPCWSPPVSGVIVDPFRPPPCRWCAGNRGLEYRVGRRAPVRSVAGGIVVFEGVVAGTRYVVVELGNGWRLTYGGLDRSAVRRGASVLSGTVIGTASGSFHFGLRVDGRYVDPQPHLGLLTGRARLVPIDGSEARAAPPPRLRCGTRSGGPRVARR